MTGRTVSNLTLKVGGTMVAVAILAVGLATLLNLLRFEESYERLAAQRLEVLAGEIGRTLAVGAGLGVRVEAQGNLPDLLRQHVADNPDLSAIVIHGCTGQTIAENGQVTGGAPWLDHLGRARWYAFGSTGLTVGLAVRDTLGGCLAGVVVQKSAESYVHVIDEVAGRFVRIGAVAAILAAFSVMAAAFYFDDRSRALRRLAADFADLAAGRAPPAPPRIRLSTLANRWERAMVETYLEARREVEAAARDETAR